MMSAWLLALAAAAVASFALTAAVIRVAHRYGLYDVPTDQRRMHTVPVPRLGGLAVFAATLAGLAVARVAPGAQVELFQDAKLYLGVLLGGGLLFAAGVVDDIRGLRPRTKLLVQLSAAVLVYAFGFRIEVLSLGGDGLMLGWLSFPLTVVWIVGVTNAFNLIDGLDGLAGGIAIVALATTAAMAGSIGRAGVVLVALALIGALLGFLPYNFNPARIFLGDSGSLFVGFSLAVLSVDGSVKSGTAVLAAVPLTALALPLLDTALAMARRWIRGVPLTSGDRRHLHHQLLRTGLTTRAAVTVLYVAATVLAGGGVLIAFAPPAMVGWLATLGAFLSLAIVVLSLRRLDYHEIDAVGVVIARAPLRLRKILRDQVNAQDIARVIGTAATREEINAVLEDSASLFDFAHMQVCELNSQVGHQWGKIRAEGGRAPWRIDYPVSSYDDGSDTWLVLRIWCYLGDGFRPYGAERVSSILGPAVDEWIQRTMPAPQPAPFEADQRVLVESRG